MSENDTIRARQHNDGSIVQVLADGSTRPLESRTDWQRIATMTEEEIEANAETDQDNPPLTTEELARLRPTPNPREIRRRLHLTQEQFSIQFHLPLGTVRDWEQGKKQPDSAARTLLRVIEKDPEAVIQALKQ
jgi:putative transcriptional regulator